MTVVAVTIFNKVSVHSSNYCSSNSYSSNSYSSNCYSSNSYSSNSYSSKSYGSNSYSSNSYRSNSYSRNSYCIWGLSETTGAFSDIYCQSNNDNHIRTSCAFYVESMQVEHSGELGR